MKKAFFILSLILCVLSVKAQDKGLDKKLLAKYSVEELNNLKKSNPQEYEFAKYCVDNAFYIAALSKEKIAKNPAEYGEVVISDLTNINFYELKIELKQSEYQVYVIKGIDKLLMIKSKDFIQQELKKK